MQIDPYFMEIKLRLIRRFIDLMDSETAELLMDTLESLCLDGIANPRHNIVVCNSNLMMVMLSVISVTNLVKKHYPRMGTRVEKF